MRNELLPVSFGNHRHLLIRFLFVLIAIGGLAVACSSKNAASGLAAEEACKQNSDCASGLICALGSCRAMCATAADCQSGGSCIDNGDVAVCQYPAEKNEPCNKESDCPSPLACASDYRCRNLCSTSADCNVLGISGRLCAKDANGVFYCAEPDEVRDGNLVATPPPGAPDTGVVEPAIDGSLGEGPDGSGGSSVDSPSAPGADGASTGTDGSSTPTDGGSSEASSGCDPACGIAQVCLNSACVACGGNGQPCCASQACGPNLSCAASGVCECGNPDEPCCNGNTCQNEVACQVLDGGSAPVCSCGGSNGATCCPGADGGAPTCPGSNLACAGLSCSCVEDLAVGYSEVVVQRFDGAILGSFNVANFAPVQWPGGTGTPVAVAISGYANIENVCAILGTAVWCFPVEGNAGSSGSFYLGAGLPTGTMVSAPLQVVTAIGVTPTLLSGATQIAGATSVGVQATFCAVTSDGSVWCWGRNTDGLLGHGDTTDASFARQVMASAGTPFAGAAEVTLGANTGCARKTNGEVWCWGDNSKGQCGSGSATPAAVSFPAKVPLLGAATALIRRPVDTFCAILSDSSVTCWGANATAQAGAPTSSGNVGPTRVLVAASGATLEGAIAIAPDDAGGATCASTTGMGLVCWGNAAATQGAARAPNPYPAVVYDSDTSAPVAGVGKAMTGTDTGDIAYLNPRGSLVNGGTSNNGGAGNHPASIQPTCN